MNIAAVLLLALQLATNQACDITKRQVLPLLRDLLETSRTAAKETERAMFLTQDDDGEIDYELWPATMQRRKASYRGVRPLNTVAIAHTHPHNMPNPSTHDIDEAERIGLPIYVVTRGSIFRVDPDRTTTEVLRHVDWASELRRGNDLCEQWS